MRLAHIDLGLSVEIKENKVNVLVVEHPKTYREIVGEIIEQIEGKEGRFVLSENSKILSISKFADFVLNPFALDFTSRKIQNKLFQLIVTDVDERLIAETSALNQEVLNFIEKALFNQSYAIGYDFELDVQALLKLYHVGFSCEDLSFVEMLIEFIRIQVNLLGTKLIVFLNIKSFVSEDELVQLYEFAFYSKVNLLLLENSLKSKNDRESTLVIDSDRCIIEL